jgi:MFS family permease
VIFLAGAALTGYLTSPIWIIVAFVGMQLALVPIDLTIDSYILPLFPKRSVLLSILQIGGAIAGSQIGFILIRNITDYFRTANWGPYYLLLGSSIIPAALLALFVRPTTAQFASRGIPSLNSFNREEKYKLKWLIGFVVGINSTYLAGSVMDIWLKGHFGPEFYNDQLGQVASLWGIIGIGLVVILSLLPKTFRKIRFGLLYVIGLVTAADFVAMVYASRQVVLVLQAAAIGLTYVFQLIYLSLMLELIPVSARAQWYQVIAVVFALARAVYEPLGLLLAIPLGYAVVILITAGLMFANIPVIIGFQRALKKGV